MTQQEYEKARQECRDALYDELFKGEVQWQPVSRYDVFCAAFDRAYALGKQEEQSKNSSEIKRELSKNSSESNPAEPTENKSDEIADKAINPIEEYFDNIIKDGSHDHNRLHIAAQIVASMIGSDDWTTWRGGSNKEIWHNMAKSSLEIADALIAEAAKGESI